MFEEVGEQVRARRLAHPHPHHPSHAESHHKTLCEFEVIEAVKDTGVEIRYYSIIYEALDDIKQMMSGLLQPEIKEQIVGTAQVREGSWTRLRASRRTARSFPGTE